MDRDSSSATNRGRSDVHAEINLHPSKGRGMSGRLEDESGPLGRAKERLGHAGESASERMGALRDRVEEMGERARGGASHLRERGARLLDDTGAGGLLSRYPLAAFGIAFGAGVLLAGSGSGRKAGMAFKAKQQLRGAIMAAVTAAAVQQGRSLLGMSSGDDGLTGVFGTDDRQPGRRRSRASRSAASDRPPVVHPD